MWDLTPGILLIRPMVVDGIPTDEGQRATYAPKLIAIVACFWMDFLLYLTELPLMLKRTK